MQSKMGSGLSLDKIQADGHTYTFYTPPEPVGWWVIGGMTWFPMYKEFTAEQIKNTEELLGWEWKDKRWDQK